MYIVRLLPHPEERAADNCFAEVISSLLHELRRAIVSLIAENEVFLSEMPTLANATPTHPTFALHDEQLFDWFSPGSHPHIRVATTTFARGEAIQPLKAIPTSSAGAIRQSLANQKVYPDLLRYNAMLMGRPALWR